MIRKERDTLHEGKREIHIKMGKREIEEERERKREKRKKYEPLREICRKRGREREKMLWKLRYSVRAPPMVTQKKDTKRGHKMVKEKYYLVYHYTKIYKL